MTDSIEAAIFKKRKNLLSADVIQKSPSDAKILRIFIIIKIIKESPEQLEKKNSDEKKSDKAAEYLFSEIPHRDYIEELENSEIQKKKIKGNDDLNLEKKII
jgi:hypothetical protein